MKRFASENNAAADQVASIFWKSDLCPTYTPDCMKVIGDVYVYDRPTALSQYTFIPHIKNVTTEAEVARELFAHDFNPRQRAIVLTDELIAINSVTDFAQSPTVQLQTESPSETILSVSNPETQPALLFRSESFDPGWKALLNNVQLPILRTNFAFQGVMIPPGQHTLTFIYQPQSFEIAKGVFLFGVALTITLGVSLRKDKAKLYG